MLSNTLNSLSMAKYERLLPRIFPGAVRLEIQDVQGKVFWRYVPGEAGENDSESEDGPVVAWSDFGAGIGRRQLADGQLQFRAALLSRDHGRIAWLIATYDVQPSVPMATAPDPLRRAFADATAFIQEEIELQTECNQLAVELTERYEELNLVYSTKDQVEYFEEGQQALDRLVHNCADYLNVGLAVLVCRDRGLTLHNAKAGDMSADIESLIEILGTTIYDRVQSQVRSLVINDNDDTERRRYIGGRCENLLAFPIIDDHGTAIGILAVVAHRDVHTFSNGDRNLLEVMAKKASRIIHTHHDSLTGLMNRSGFESSLVAALASTRNKNLQHCLLHIDVDQLHVINDLMGHQEGDALIRRVAKVLRSALRDSDYIARLGGDEFGALLANCDPNQAHAIANKIRNAVHELTVVSAQRQLSVSASIGIAPMTPETESIVGVMASAEIACKSAKEHGRDRIEVFQEDNTTLVRRSEEIEWIGRVQLALSEDHFVLQAQPVRPLINTDLPDHFELLIRMTGDEGELISPVTFLPAAERYQLMPLIDRWVVRTALHELGLSWEAISATDPVFCINLSGQSLTNPGFLEFIRDEIRQGRVPPSNICFEITETAAISNIDEAIALIRALQGLGCRFALDDFGAGLSSFGYLKELPVDYLKIDGSFVRNVCNDDVSLAMVSAICQIGRTMGLSMVAEFVGDDETMKVLSRIGVDFVQGYHVGKPAPLQDITAALVDDAPAASA